ncbi:energy transducer TonB [Rhodovulum sp. DZ06]|uniref:energy transducer TonB n=1 Tax=Rhodovulum sp. DZ06 TaxID=3425126 RepID=UPI003D33B53E
MSLADPAPGRGWAAAGLGLALSLALHAGGWAGVLSTPPEPPETLPEGVEGALLVTLDAPEEEAAAAAPAHDAPRGAAAPEVMAAPQAPESEQTLARSVDTPPMQTTPYRVKDPSLAFDIANPDMETNVDRTPDEVPTEAQEAQAAPQAPSRSALPPPAAGARKARAQARAKQEGLEQEKRAQVSAWKRKLAVALDGLKTYPAAALPDRAQGRAVLALTLDRHGRVLGARLMESAGHPALDAAALAIADRAGRLPAPPAHMTGERFEIAAPITYRVL